MKLIQWHGNFITTNAGDNVIADIDKIIMYSIPRQRRSAPDVTGAGDCFLAGFVYGLTKGYDYKKSVRTWCKRIPIQSVKHVGTYILAEKDPIKRVVFTQWMF